MLGRMTPPVAPEAHFHAAYRAHAGPRADEKSARASILLEAVRTHLGGEPVLTSLGARRFLATPERVSFRLEHPNPAGVRTVVVTVEPNGFFAMDCFGEAPAGGLTPVLAGYATQIVPDSLATVLGKLTGLESIHHRHY